MIAGQLSLEPTTGLVLSNGEFGQRLVSHAQRFGLRFEVLEVAWGKPFDLAAVRRKLETEPAPGWLWSVHCETSSGVLTDLEGLKALCSEFQVKLCLDAISSIGTVPIDLAGVHLASCSSGKGLRAYPGIAMVFYDYELPGAAITQQHKPENLTGLSRRDSEGAPMGHPLPRYLDLAFYAGQGGVPFTFSSNLLHALQAAIKRVQWNKRFAELEQLSSFVRPRLRELEFTLVSEDAVASPAVITIALPEALNSVRIGNLIQESGYLLSYNSEYLQRRNWIQICFMSECAREKVVSLISALNRICSPAARAVPLRSP